MTAPLNDDDLLGSFRLDVEEPEVPDPRNDAPPEVPPKEKTPAELAEEVRLLTAERDIALKAMSRPIEAPAAQVYQPPAPAGPDPALARQQFDNFLEGIATKQMTGDVKGATTDLLGFVDTIVQDRLSKANVPLANQGARQAVRNFKASMRDDSLFPRVQEEFDRLAEQAMPGIAGMQPDQQDNAIEAIYNIAVGQTARRQSANGRREVPPAYGAGSASSGARPASRGKALNGVQRQYVESARAAGIPDDRIRKVLDEMDRES